MFFLIFVSGSFRISASNCSNRWLVMLMG